MRIAPAKLLILVALLLVILVELRTVLAFFEIDVSLGEIAVLGAVAIGALVYWATRPSKDEQTDS